jgi:hypothetical protein
MPPKVIKNIRDLIFWQCAKIISQSAGYGKKQFGFVMDRFKKLSSGEINWSNSIREYVKEREKKDLRIYARALEKHFAELFLGRIIYATPEKSITLNEALYKLSKELLDKKLDREIIPLKKAVALFGGNEG